MLHFSMKQESTRSLPLVQMSIGVPDTGIAMRSNVGSRLSSERAGYTGRILYEFVCVHTKHIRKVFHLI